MRSPTVRGRLSLIAAAVAFLGLGAAAVGGYLVTTASISREVDQSLQSSPVAAADGVSNFPSSEEFCGNFEEDQPSLGLYHSQLVRVDGTRCRATGEELVLPADPATMAGATGSIALRDGRFISGAPARIAEVRLADGSVLVVGRDLRPIENIRRILMAALSMVVVLGTVLVWLLSRWTVGIGLRPVSRFAVYAERVAAAGSLRGVDPVEPPPSRPGEGDDIDRLSRALHDMAVSLRSAQDRQHRLVADAGHELRTPLASLRNNIALLRRSREKDRPLLVAELDELLADLDGQTRELTDLVEDVVQLSVDRATEAPTEEVRWDECVRRSVERARRRGRSHHIVCRTRPWLVYGDASSLERAVMNLIDNALKFSPVGSTVSVTLAHGLLEVADDGQGIDAEDVTRAFERFWRSPAARSRPGSGLGLAIVAESARIHGGWADLAPDAVGTTARMFVPGRAPADIRGQDEE